MPKTPSESYEHSKELARLRQRKYYEKNKSKIASTKKTDKVDLRAFRENGHVQPAVAAEPCDCDAPVVDDDGHDHFDHEYEQDNEPEPIQEALPEPLVVAPQGPAPKIKRKGPITKDTIIEWLKERQKSYPDNVRSIKTHIDGIKRLFKCVNCNDFAKCILDFKKIVKAIETGTFVKGGVRATYSEGTVLSTLSSLLYVVDNMGIPISKKVNDEYKDLHALYVMKSKERTAARKLDTNFAVPTPEVLKAKVIAMFGKDSVEDMIISIYEECSLRDNFNLLIVDGRDKMTLPKQNYIEVPKTRHGQLLIVIQRYKTVKKYKALEYEISAALGTKIKGFMKSQKLDYGSQLFKTDSDGKFTKYLSAMMQKMDISGGGANVLRHVKFSSHKELSDKELIVEARKAGHSVEAHRQYARVQLSGKK